MARLPKAELHLHQEKGPRLERIAARRGRRDPFDWSGALARLDGCPPGRQRLDRIYEPDPVLDYEGVSDDDDAFVARVASLLEEAADEEAILVEVRFGSDQIHERPDFMALFRAGEASVRERCGAFWAEAIAFVVVTADEERRSVEDAKLRSCLAAASHGLGGVDFITEPYDA